jgi:hypothetical protein
MHGRTSIGSDPRLWAAVVLLAGALAWLVPNPLPWRSPFESRNGTPIAAGPGGLDLAAGAEAVAHTTRSVPPAPKTTTPPTSTVPPKSTTPGTVPAAFKGSWHGHGTNFVGSGNFDTVVTFPEHTARLVVATADFPTFGCQEAWQLRKTTPTVLTLQATVASGLCVQRPLTVTVTLLDPRRVYVRWVLANGVVESDATLTRV